MNGRRALGRHVSKDASWALGIGFLSLVILVIVHLPHLSSFVVSGDDYALVQHSARFFSPSLADWIGNGYRGYNALYPELGAGSTNFIRPTQNAAVYLDSWLSPSPRSVTLLFSNYVGHAACVSLVFLVGRSIFGLSRRASLLASALLLGSVSVGILPLAVAYGGDMIAALFALIALLALHSHLAVRPAVWKVVLVGVSLLLGLFAKESVLGAPLVLVIYAIWIRTRSSDQNAIPGTSAAVARRISWGPVAMAIAVPSALYASARLAAGLHGMYVLEETSTRLFGIPRLYLEPLRFALTAFFPVETETLKEVVTGSVTGGIVGSFQLALGRAVLVVGLNAVAWFLVVRLLLIPAERARLWAPLTMGLVASAVAITKADPRLLYFSQCLLLPLLVLALTRWWAPVTSAGRRLPRWLVPVAVSSILLVGPMYYILQEIIAQPNLVANNEMTTHFQDAILTAISDPRIHRLYLVNASGGGSMTPPLSLLRFLAAVGGRPDLHVRVVNTLSGPIPADDAQGSVEFVRRGDEIRGLVTVGRSQSLFGGITPTDARQLGEPGVIAYGPLKQFDLDALGNWTYTGTQFSFGIPHASREDSAIVGFDPGREGFFALLPGLQWTRVS